MLGRWRGLGRAPMPGLGLLCRAGAAGWRSAKPYDSMIRMTRRAGVSGAPGNRHQPFFGCCAKGLEKRVCVLVAREVELRGIFPQSHSCPRGVPRGVPLNPGVTTGLKGAILG